MRGGYFLAEESPESLMIKFNAETLEQVFLELSLKQNEIRRRQNSVRHNKSLKDEGVVNESADPNDGSLEDNETSGDFGDIPATSRQISITYAENQELSEIPPEEKREMKIKDYLCIASLGHIKALTWVNFLWMWRNFPVMIFILVLPVLQDTLFCLSIGHDPINLPVAVINYEANSYSNCSSIMACNSTMLSCNYLTYLERRGLVLV